MLDKEPHFRSMVWSERVIDVRTRAFDGPGLATPVLQHGLAKGGFGAKLGSAGSIQAEYDPVTNRGRAKEEQRK
jgi:hypothetical protein